MGNEIFSTSCQPICFEPIQKISPRHSLTDSEREKVLNQYHQYLDSKKCRKSSNDRLGLLDPNMLELDMDEIQRINENPSKLDASIRQTSN